MNEAKLTVLVVEDDESFRSTLDTALSKKFNTILSANATDGLQQALTKLPNLVLLDINMAGESGISLCRSLRDNALTKHIPIIMMTGNNFQEVRIESFEAGADDFLPKPFGSTELTARIESKIRRSSEATVLRHGDLELDSSNFSVSVSGSKVEIGLIEFRMLAKLMQRAMVVVKRSELESYIWGVDLPQTRSLDTHISTLRKKLAHSKVQLRTVYGTGYILE